MKQFVKIYEEEMNLLDDCEIKTYMKFKLMLGSFKKDDITIRQEKISELTNNSLSSTKRIIKSLINKGLVKKEKRGQRNAYSLPIAERLNNTKTSTDEREVKDNTNNIKENDMGYCIGTIEELKEKRYGTMEQKIDNGITECYKNDAMPSRMQTFSSQLPPTATRSYYTEDKSSDPDNEIDPATGRRRGFHPVTFINQPL